MNVFPTFKQAAFRYWEFRRIFYNLVMVPPALFSYTFASGIHYGGEPHATHYFLVLFLLAISAIGANVCYTFVYALEFFFGSAEPTAGWLRGGRTVVFVAGILFAVALALVGGYNIAGVEFYFETQEN